MSGRIATVLVAAGVLLGGACGGPTEQADVDAAGADAGHEDTHEIAWFDGSYEEAVEFAATEGKPLLLYWGAEWCPPCHYLKTKVFHKPDFVAATRKVVPVYLDGDTERAQTLGEKLGVAGYPTVILYAPGGAEITRLPTGVDAEAYAAQLERALHETRPVTEVLASVMAAGPGEADAADLSLLAFHSWDQDESLSDDPESTLATLRRLWTETPPDRTLERARFLTAYLSNLSGADPAVELSANERTELAVAVRELLSDAASRDASMEFVLFDAGDTVALLYPEPSTDREGLEALWVATALAIADDASQNMDDRVAALIPELEFALGAGGEAELDDALATKIADRVAWADAEIADESELQAVLNTMVYLLVSIDRPEAAEELILRRLDDAHAPYYFMSRLAGLRQDAGDTAGAMEWFRKAYDASRGRYSRFRWGSLLVRRHLELTPDDIPAIEAVSEEVLTELLQYDDAFSLGNHSRLQQMEEALVEWAAENDGAETVDRLHGIVSASCDRFDADADDEQRERCETAFAV